QLSSKLESAIIVLEAAPLEEDRREPAPEDARRGGDPAPPPRQQPRSLRPLEAPGAMWYYPMTVAAAPQPQAAPRPAVPRPAALSSAWALPRVRQVLGTKKNLQQKNRLAPGG
ncbi:MAG: hypothetical protein ACPIOQ_62150, partial [Promethearchaeia archaeon]